MSVLDLVVTSRQAALVVVEVTTKDEAGETYFINTSSLFIRGLGGFGGERGPAQVSLTTTFHVLASNTVFVTVTVAVAVTPQYLSCLCRPIAVIIEDGSLRIPSPPPSLSLSLIYDLGESGASRPRSGRCADGQDRPEPGPPLSLCRYRQPHVP